MSDTTPNNNQNQEKNGSKGRGKVEAPKVHQRTFDTAVDLQTATAGHGHEEETSDFLTPAASALAHGQSGSLLQRRPSAPISANSSPATSSFTGWNFSHIPAQASVRPRIQPKLMVGPANDQYEQEADQMAAQVMGMPTPVFAPNQGGKGPVQRQEEEDELAQMKPLAMTISSLQRQEEDDELAQMKPFLQRQEDEDELAQMKPQLIQRNSATGFATDNAFEDNLNRQRGSGSPLPAALRADLEPKFGADFSGVKVHTDAESHQLNQSIQAKAFTTGQDVFFRQGAYEPGSRGGQELIAHELTHVVQQNGAPLQRQEKMEEAVQIQPTVLRQEEGGLIQGQYEPMLASGSLTNGMETAVSNAQISGHSPLNLHHSPLSATAIDYNAIQRDPEDSTGMKALKGTGKVGLGMVHALVGAWSPKFWYDYFDTLGGIWTERESRKNKLKYGETPGIATTFRVIDTLTETANMVAGAATSLTFIFNILGAILMAAYGAGAPLLAIGTVCGTVAAIAHLVAFLLRGILLARNVYQLSQYDRKSKEYEFAKGQFWKNTLGMAANGLGALLGGLGGALSGGIGPMTTGSTGTFTNVADNSVGKVFADAGIGQIGGTGGDISNVIGDEVEEQYTEKAKGTNNIPVTQEQPISQINVDQILEGLGVATGQTEKDKQHSTIERADLVEQTSAANSTGKKVDEMLDQSTQTQKHISDIDTNSEQTINTTLAQPVPKPSKGESEQRDSQVGQAENDMTRVEEQVEVIENQLPPPQQSVLKQVPTPEPQQAVLVIPPQPQYAAIITPAPQMQQAVVTETPQPQQAVLRKKPVSVSHQADPTIIQPKFSDKLKKKWGNFKSWIKGLFQRVVQVGKRVKVLLSKVKAKLTAMLLRMLGIDKPVQELGGQMNEVKSEIPQALKAEQITSADREAFAEKVEEAKAVIKQNK